MSFQANVTSVEPSNKIYAGDSIVRKTDSKQGLGHRSLSAGSEN